MIAEGDDPVHIGDRRRTGRGCRACEVPADVRDALSSDWVSSWLRLTAERLLSYADKDAQP